MSIDLNERLKKSMIYQQLEEKCNEKGQHEVLSLVLDVGNFAIERLKTVIKNMPEFTLHDETHIFNMMLYK